MTDYPKLIPRPLDLQAGTEHLRLDHGATIHAGNTIAEPAAVWFQNMLHQLTGLRLQTAEKPDRACITLRLDDDLACENYSLRINSDGVEVTAADAAGFLYGLVSLLQCVSLEEPCNNGEWHLPLLSMRDGPRFRWRGLMLDSSRYFQPVAFIEKLLDVMVLHKFNVLHWHLADDQGWRIDIGSHPALSSISAWRRETRSGHENRANGFDARPHGGFYSKRQLCKLVDYAQTRGITIVPEIEMPGHTQAVLAAYPQLSCSGGPFEVSTHWGVHADVFCAGNDEVFRFLEAVLHEVLEIFPSPFIHIGGDECPKVRWQECPKCQRRLSDENLADEHELQSWFVRHFDAFLHSRGRRLIGWDEILEGGLARNAVVMSWRGETGGIAAAQAGHDTVMAPHQKTYFDYYQSTDEATEPLAIGGCTTLEQVYAYEPIPHELTDEQATHVLGAQGQLWTEYMPRPDNVEYMAFPRACALAEVLWSSGPGDFDEFCTRLREHLHRLDRLGVKYRAVPGA